MAPPGPPVPAQRAPGGAAVQPQQPNPVRRSARKPPGPAACASCARMRASSHPSPLAVGARACVQGAHLGDARQATSAAAGAQGGAGTVGGGSAPEAGKISTDKVWTRASSLLGRGVQHALPLRLCARVLRAHVYRGTRTRRSPLHGAPARLPGASAHAHAHGHARAPTLARRRTQSPLPLARACAPAQASELLRQLRAATSAWFSAVRNGLQEPYAFEKAQVSASAAVLFSCLAVLSGCARELTHKTDRCIPQI